MKVPWSRAMAVVAAAIAMVVGSLFLVGPASAQPVQSGSFSLTSDPDDPIALGQSFSYDTTAGDEMSVAGDGDDGHSIGAVIDGTDGNDWNLSLAGPAGKALAPGTYTITTAESTPGISLWRPNYFCWGLGSFTIDKIEWGPSGYVHALDATFDYHCWGDTPAVRGQLHILNPPPPPVLKVGLTVAGHGTVSELNGSANLHGTVKCNKATVLVIRGTIVQTRKGQSVQGEYSQDVTCTPGARVAWSTTLTPPEGMTFSKGHARTRNQASGIDGDYDTLATGKDVTAVTFTNEKT